MKTQSPIFLLSILLAIFCGAPQAQAASYTLTITATNGTVTTDPNHATFEAGSVVYLNPLPNAGYCFSNWTGDITSSRLVGRVVMTGNKSITANFETWHAPIGIPAPTFGITQTYRGYDGGGAFTRNESLTYSASDSGGFYTHYVDSTTGTDTGRPYGTKLEPRQTIPYNPPQGSVIEIHGPVVENYGMSQITLVGNGTSASPIFFRGVGLPRSVLPAKIGYDSQTHYVIVEGMSFCSGNIDGISTSDSDTTYTVVRNCEFRGTTQTGGFYIASNRPPSRTRYCVFYGNVIRDNGVWDPNIASGDNDIGGMILPYNTDHNWVVDNVMFHNEMDAVQTGAQGDPEDCNNIWIGRNIGHHNKQSGFWVKTSNDVVVSENVAYGGRWSSSSQGAGLGCQYHNLRIWFLNNDVFDCSIGFHGPNGQAANEVYVIGNAFHDLKVWPDITDQDVLDELEAANFDYLLFDPNSSDAEAAVCWYGGEDRYLINNTIYNVSAGIYVMRNNDMSLHISNNLVANVTVHNAGQGKHLYIYDTQGTLSVENNLFYHAGGNPLFRWGQNSDVTTWDAWHTLSDTGNNGIIADPQFTNPSSHDFHLQSTSPAIDAGTSSGVVREVLDRFEQLYGIDIRKDIEGRARPQGSAWDIGAYEYVLSAIGDLAVSGTSQNSATLAWTVAGEEGVTGTPTRYDIRYASGSITEANWDAATQVQGEPVPGGFGTQQSFTITVLNPGATYYVAIKVGDDAGHTSQLSNVVSGTTTTSGNHAPVLEQIGNKSVIENGTLTFAVNATDADPGDTLTYSATRLPAGADFNPATRTFTWTPTIIQSGTYRVTFQVGDGQITVSETITITVGQVANHAPVLAAIGNKSVNENALLSFSISATDLDEDALTYSATGLPNEANFVNHVFSWIPTYGQAGYYSVTFTVSDGELTDTEQITITVVNVTDQTAPSVHDCYPLADAIQVPLNPLIALTISDAGLGVDANSVTLQVDGQAIYSGDRTVHETTYGVCRRTGTQASYRYYYQPAQTFGFDQQVFVRVTASDMAHNAMTPVSYQFVTEMRALGVNCTVNGALGGLNKGSPATARDSLGNIWVAYHAGPVGQRYIYTSKLAAGSSSFTGSIRLTTNAGDQSNPDIAIGTDDKLYVVWQDNRRGNWDVFLRTSANGETWSGETRVTDSNDNHVAPVIVVDTQSPNCAYVAWQDDGANNQDIYVAKSSDDFSTKTVYQVTSNASDQVAPAIAADAADNVYLVWTDHRSGKDDIYGAASNSGSWTNVAVVTGAGNQFSPAIATEGAGSVLHFVWVNDATGNRDIYYASSDALPTSPLSGTNIIDDTSGADQTAPAIAATGSTGDGLKVFVCWQDRRNVATNSGDTDLYFVEATAQNTTNILVGDDGTKSGQSEPDIGVDIDGHPYAVWVDDRNATTGIYYAGSTFMEANPLQEQTVTASVGKMVGTTTPAGEDDVSVLIPAGACPCDATITITRIQNPPSEYPLGYDFGPSGFQFSLPVTITIPYAVADFTDGHPYPRWYNSLTGALSQQGITNVEHVVISSTLHAIRFQTTHFTPYCLVEISAGGGGGGGGGCALSTNSHNNVVVFFLPYLGLAVAIAASKLWHGNARRSIGH